MKVMLDPVVVERLVDLLTPEEDQQLWEYATGGELMEFTFKVSEWLVRRFNLTVQVPAGSTGRRYPHRAANPPEGA